MNKISNLIRSRSKKHKKIKEGDIVYNRIPLNQFASYHLFKVIKVEFDSVNIESERTGEIVNHVTPFSLKKSNLFN